MRLWAEIHDNNCLSSDAVVAVRLDGRTVVRATYEKGDISDAESVLESLGYQFQGRPAQVVSGILRVSLKKQRG